MTQLENIVHRVFDQVAQIITIDQVQLGIIPRSSETSVNNVASLFVKLNDIYFFTKDIKEKLSKIDEDMKASAH